MKRGFRRLAMIGMVLAFTLLSLLPTYGETNCSFAGGVDRVSGSDRYATSANLANECFTSADKVIVATGENFADALAGSALAAAVEGPILLTKTNELPTSVENVLDDLDPDKVYILGGTGAVSTGVEDDIRDMGISIVRISGDDRYETSAEIANEVEKIEGNISEDTVIVATGENFPDALSASALAAEQIFPILLVKKNDVPTEVTDALEDLDITRALVIGGTGVISESTVDDLDVSDTERLSGDNRYETAEDVYNFSIDEYNMSDTIVYVASGTSFPDALVAGPVAAMEDDAPIILSNKGPTADPSVLNFWEDNGDQLEDVVIIGGTAAITTNMEDLFDDALDGDIDDDTGSGSGSSTAKGDLHLTLDATLGASDIDLTAHVEDDDDDDVENADVEITEVSVKASGDASFTDVTDEVCDVIDCTKDTDADGDAEFNNIPQNGLGSGDQVRLEVNADKSDYDDDTTTESVTIP